MRPSWLLVVALAAAGLVAGCASPPPKPEAMRDPAANFSHYRTFGWADGGAAAGSEAPAGTTPDLRIAYETASAQKLENNPVRVGIGVGSWGGNMGGSVSMGSPSVRNYTEGSLVLHAIDTARNAEVWQGRISGKLSKGSTEPAAINQAVAQAMADFPVR
jgi:hypothetical protein